MFNKIRFGPFLLLIIILFHLVNNLIWFSQDGNQYLGCETVFHLQRAFEIFSQNNNASLTHAKISRIAQVKTKVTSGIPSTYAAVSANLADLFNINFLSLKPLNIIYLFLIILFTYLIGKNLKDEQTGLFAAFLVSFYPMVYGLSRKFSPVIALTAIVCAAYYLLIKSKNFKDTKYSIILGITGFLGLIIHPLFLFFICGGLIYSAYAIIRYKDKSATLRTVNLFFCVIIMLLSVTIIYDNYAHLSSGITETLQEMRITLTTYSKNFVGNADKAKDDLFIFASPDDSCPCTQFSDRGLNLRCFSFYLFQLFDSASPFLFIIFLISLILYARDKGCREKPLLFLWIFLSYFLLTLLPRKWGRFYAPALPAAAIISACQIMSIKKEHLKNFLAAVIMIIAVTQFFIYSYVFAPYTPYPGLIKESLSAHKPVPANYNRIAQEIMESMNNNAAADKKIGLFDITTSSGRFSEDWYDDLTYYFQILLKLHSKTNASFHLHWNLSSRGLEKNKYIFLIIIKDRNSVFEENLFSRYSLSNRYLLQPADLDVLVYVDKFYILTQSHPPSHL
ncbi:MAG: glycosyltransferase family 39 protein [Candidatus Omnitrophica bacterium]|nr:glycosyltransferase family 39 protein [Candidatus Omnitrophota bacterium]MBU4479446.1 glycosyltransferase family 39 protein [Candidatus Omnitrophota bacterium]MCG2703516.1 glycosyltransferase family 39 protein [Candidatus Omnitrophota bacterium]